MKRAMIGLTASLSILVAGLGLCGLALAAEPQPRRLHEVNSWAYQLQNADPVEIAGSPFDLIVIDYSRNGNESGRFTPEEVRAMQRKPDGSRRYVIAYLSIGEAEEYRYYWDKKWIQRAPHMRSRIDDSAETPPQGGPEPKTARIPRLVAPSWLGSENPRWPGNFLVRYWYDNWQELIMHNDDSYLSRIIEAGFDGVYLDRIDAFYETRIDQKFAIEKMVDFIVELAQIARKKRPGFVVIPQNAEQLLEIPRYRAVIDAAAKEDFMFGLTEEGKLNSIQVIASASTGLRYVKEDGLPVLLVEYLDDPVQIKSANGLARSLGYIPYFAPRGLDRLVVPGAP